MKKKDRIADLEQEVRTLKNKLEESEDHIATLHATWRPQEPHQFSRDPYPEHR